jgi:L-fuconate dehydratase
VSGLDATITRAVVYDVRFPTSGTLAGSDAMNEAPDYSAAYVVLETDGPGGLEGHGLTFTIGRGTEIVVAAVEALAPLVVGRRLRDVAAAPGRFWREVTGDSHLRWLGPDKGVVHLATAALVNAVWDVWAKAEGKPLWKLVVDLTPEELVACVDSRYLTDALTPDDALALLRARAAGRAEREAHRPRPRGARPLPRARGARVLDRDAPGVAARLRLPGRRDVAGLGEPGTVSRWTK